MAKVMPTPMMISSDPWRKIFMIFSYERNLSVESESDRQMSPRMMTREY
jgi:hypothetical protein